LLQQSRKDEETSFERLFTLKRAGDVKHKCFIQQMIQHLAIFILSDK